MRLINCDTLRLETFDNEFQVPPYAILSHCWGSDEIIYVDMTTNPPDPGSPICATKRWQKVCRSCETTKKEYGLDYIWIDTCCIDKSSSAELSEAINSMYIWYWRSEVCIAYLPDVSGKPDPTTFNSRWFTRGWTLQELLAPRKLDFFNDAWENIGDRAELAAIWSDDVCNIDRKILQDGGREILRDFSVATRLSWASRRVTTRGEDRAYSLLGIFGVNMPTLYGEGYERAFLRLQAKIFKTSADQSIFAWQFPSSKVDYPSIHPWECNVYGEANTTCQESITGLHCISYVDAIRPWRLNNEPSYRTWTTNTKPIKTAYLFAPNLECFRTPWHSLLTPSDSFDFKYNPYLPSKTWSFSHAAPSRRYGPRTQMVMSRLASWMVRKPKYPEGPGVEFALYLCFLPIHILRRPSGSSSSEQPQPLPAHYVAVHMVECSMDPGTFRRVRPTEVFVVNMSPVKKIEDFNYWPQEWVGEPHMRDNILRVDPQQEQKEMKDLERVQERIRPKIRDVFLAKPGEGEGTTTVVLDLKPMPHQCVRFQTVFLETGKLSHDGWEIVADTDGDESALEQTTISHLENLRTKSSRKRPETKHFRAWYRHPKTRNMYDTNAEKSMIRVFLSDKAAGEGFGIILSTHRDMRAQADDGGDASQLSTDERAYAWTELSRKSSLLIARLQIQSPRAYSSKQKPDVSHYDEFVSDQKCVQICNCSSDTVTLSDQDSGSSSFTTVLVPTPSTPGPQPRNLHDDQLTCGDCGGCHMSRAADPCDRLVVFTLKTGRKVTVGFVEPKRRLMDDIRLGPMLILKIVIGGPSEWMEEVKRDQENGLEPAELGETLWKQVGPPPVFSQVEDRGDTQPINIGGWGAIRR